MHDCQPKFNGRYIENSDVIWNAACLYGSQTAVLVSCGYVLGSVYWRTEQLGAVFITDTGNNHEPFGKSGTIGRTLGQAGRRGP